MDLSIITPVWNHSQLTWSYLSQSFIYLAHVKDNIEYIIIDNGSTDNTRDILSRLKSQASLKIISNEKNLGFSIACNQGANLAIGRNLLFLNNDVIIQGDYVSFVKGYLDQREKIIIGVDLYKHDTGWNTFGDRIIEYIPGWYLAIRHDSFFDLGCFDERYSPCDYEDLDLCMTAQQQGYELIKCSHLPIKHISGQSGLQIGVEKRKEITRKSRLKFAEKWGL